MLPCSIAGLLALLGSVTVPTDRERAAVAVLRYETAAERRRQLDRKAIVTFGGEALTDAEGSAVREIMERGESKGPPVFPLRNLIFRHIDRLGPGRYRVGAVPQTHPPGPPTYATYIVALELPRDRVVSASAGRMMALGPRDPGRPLERQEEFGAFAFVDRSSSRTLPPRTSRPTARRNR